MPFHPRVICSTITLRHLPLNRALTEIRAAGFGTIDLGALPGVCDHVPFTLDARAVEEVAATVRASGLTVRSVNGDIGDLNLPIAEASRRDRAVHAEHLLDLCVEIDAAALVLPNGAQSHDPTTTLEEDLDRVAAQLTRVAERARERGVELWVEAPHFFRLAFDLDRTEALLRRLPEEIGVVCDVSHIVAGGSTPEDFLDRFSDRTRHVHLRDAEPGYIHHSISRGQVDFAGLARTLTRIGYRGDLALELETRDVADAERAMEARRAGELVSSLLTQAAGAANGRRAAPADADGAPSH